MAGPWEQYQTALPAVMPSQPEADGPWTAYAPTAQPKPTPTFTPGPEGFRKSLNEAIAADPSPAGAQFVGGVGTALDQAALRAKQIFSTLTPQDVQKVEANRMLSSTPLGFTGSVAGNVGMFGRLPM